MTYRPTTLIDYVGQSAIKPSLNVRIRSLKKQRSIGQSAVFPHTLIIGGSGLGKTTISAVIANEMGGRFIDKHAPSLGRQFEELIQQSLQEGDFLFLDEIHALDLPTSEKLYTVMEDRTLHITKIINKQKKQLKIPLPNFTIIGATTESGKVPGPMRNRFKYQMMLEPYTDDELAIMSAKLAKKMNFGITKEAALYLARCCRGMAREVGRLLDAAQYYIIDRGAKVLTLSLLLEIFKFERIYDHGINAIDLKILEYLYTSGEAVSLDTLSNGLSLSNNIIQEAHEPFLIALNLIQRTSRGRKLSTKGQEVYIKIKESVAC